MTSGGVVFPARPASRAACFSPSFAAVSRMSAWTSSRTPVYSFPWQFRHPFSVPPNVCACVSPFFGFSFSTWHPTQSTFARYIGLGIGGTPCAPIPM